MQIAIISSSKDTAGINIRNNLIELFEFEKINEKFDGNDVVQFDMSEIAKAHTLTLQFKASQRFPSMLKNTLRTLVRSVFDKIKNKTIKLYLINQDLIFAENIDKKINADFFIFASKHRSKENTPSFTVHSIGNFGNADFGGEEKKLCPSSAVLLKNLLIELNENGKNSNYGITLEATHHGPFVEKPSVFVEIGSTEKEWSDKQNGEIIAKAIMNGLGNENKNYKIAVGIGGPHYCGSFNKIMLRTDIAVSHICPKYHLEKLNEDLIQQSIQKTTEKVDFVLLDWKGLGKEKQRIVEMLKNLNLEFRRTGKI